jgi:hypothetical protein
MAGKANKIREKQQEKTLGEPRENSRDRLFRS